MSSHYLVWKEGRKKDGRTEGRKDRRKEEGRQEGRQTGRNSDKSKTDFQRIISFVSCFSESLSG